MKTYPTEQKLKPLKHRVTVNLDLDDAKNVNRFLDGAFSSVPAEDTAVKKLQYKLGLQLGRVDSLVKTSQVRTD